MDDVIIVVSIGGKDCLEIGSVNKQHCITHFLQGGKLFICNAIACLCLNLPYYLQSMPVALHSGVTNAISTPYLRCITVFNIILKFKPV